MKATFVFAAACLASANAYAPAKPLPSCAGSPDYTLGYRTGAISFKNAYMTFDNKCNKLDKTIDITSAAAPQTPYCKTLGFQNAVFDGYAKEQEKCFKDCKGNGKLMGETLGAQFCAIASYSASRSSPPPTVAICNSVEQQACEDRYAYYVDQKCAKSKSSNADYYNSLKKACKSL